MVGGVVSAVSFGGIKILGSIKRVLRISSCILNQIEKFRNDFAQEPLLISWHNSGNERLSPFIGICFAGIAIVTRDPDY